MISKCPSSVMTFTVTISVREHLRTCTINDIGGHYRISVRISHFIACIPYHGFGNIFLNSVTFTIHCRIRTHRGNRKRTVSMNHYFLRDSICITTIISNSISSYYLDATRRRFKYIVIRPCQFAQRSTIVTNRQTSQSIHFRH